MRLKDCFFSTLYGLLTTHSNYNPMGLYPGELKSTIHFTLGPAWAYTQVSLFSGESF